MAWEEIFKEGGDHFLRKPHEDLKKLIKLFKKNKVKRVLDLGCGSGRHVVALAKEGFEVYGMDNAPSGLKQTRLKLKKDNLKAKLKNSDCYKDFPYKDNFFDAVISVQVIHHAKIKQIEKCISEIERVIKPKGYVFVTVTKCKYHKSTKTKMKIIEPNTYIMLNGFEKGVPHHIFNITRLRKYFNKFKIIDIWTDKTDHYCLLGEFTSLLNNSIFMNFLTLSISSKIKSIKYLSL